MFRFFKHIGPGPLIAAAFIGPGTVTVCTLAGVHYGYCLLWALLFSIIATITLQEMAARLGVISQKGLAENLKAHISSPILKSIFIILLLMAIVIGNAAYEAGNISGASLGLEALIGENRLAIFMLNLDANVLFIGLLAFLALYFGNYKFLERFLVFLVLLMSLSFIITALAIRPDWDKVLSGLIRPEVNSDNIFTVIALVGTTVVPYNLFLHTSLASTKWKSKNDLNAARLDTVLAIGLGGLISMAIVVAATKIELNEVTNVADLAIGLEPVLGPLATYIVAVGLCAAGITSAITAPLAAAYVASGCLDWSADIKSKSFRWVWMLILVIGVIFSSLDYSPIAIIKVAQIANGLVLPLVAIFLLWILNNSKILGPYVNSKFQNSLGVLIVVLTIILGVKGVLGAISFW